MRTAQPNCINGLTVHVQANGYPFCSICRHYSIVCIHGFWFISLFVYAYSTVQLIYDYSLSYSFPLGRSGSLALPYDPHRYRQLYVMLCCRFPLLCCFSKNVPDVPPIRITSLPLFHSPRLSVSLIVQYYVIHHPVIGTLIYRVSMPGQKSRAKPKGR